MPRGRGRTCPIGCLCKRHTNSGTFGDKHVGRPTSEAVKEVLRLKALAQWKNPEIRDRMLINMRSPEKRQKMSDHFKEYYSDPAHRTQARLYGAMASGRGPTFPEKVLACLLNNAFDEVVLEMTFGRYRVDAYVPSHHMAFEADSDHWHDADYDRERDEYLMEYYELPVVRLHERELRAMVK